MDNGQRGRRAGVSARPIITLMTDFGDSDAYVGAMKGAILSIAPDAAVVDIAHNIPPFNLLSAAYLLTTYFAEFPPGTAHIAVVDPGVGGARDCLAVKAAGRYLLLPDNGIAGMALDAAGDGWEARRIANPALMAPKVSPTFHGRDVFAPAAARLVSGFPFSEVGPATFRIERLKAASVSIAPGSVSGAVVHIDRFGNFITNVMDEHIDRAGGKAFFVTIGEYTIMGLSETYESRPPGELLAYVGSSGRLEIGVSRGRASDIVGKPVGSPVTVRSRPSAL